MPIILLHPISTLTDPTLPDVLDIYQASFPPREQVRMSWWLQLLRGLSREEKPTGTLLALCEASTETVVGMAYYEIEEFGEERLGFLWYLATDSKQRNRGLGAAAYQAIVSQILDTESCTLMLFEIEIADEVAQSYPHEPTLAELARRREAWYRRNGAQKLTGIHYEQSVGWLPAMPMHLLFHSRQSLTPEQAFSYAQQLTDAIQTGSLGLEP